MRVYEEIGLMILGSWLKKISHLFQQDILKIYEKEGIRFELSWFPVFYMLQKEKQLPVTSLANCLELSHPAVIQVLKSLRKEGLVEFREDATDRRKRQVKLTQQGYGLIERVRPVWKKMEQSIAQLMEESGITKNLREVLVELEKSFAKKSLAERYMELNNTEQ
mgnify:CR=1 FL=1